jgi:enoyl-CoA hydratase/carnithine racemase
MTSRIGDIHIQRDGAIATVTLARPPHNMMSVDLASDLATALEQLDSEPDMRAVILAAEGKSFCAGADFSRPREGIGIDATHRPHAGNPLYGQAERLFSTQLPIIAAIQGPAVGAGLGLALVADFRIASPEARFVANFVKLGFHPGFGLTHTLPRLVGAQKAARIFLTGDRVKAEEALAIGLVDEVAPVERLMEAARRLAGSIAVNAPIAVRSTRATLRAGLAAAVRQATNHEHAEQQAHMRTEDFREGVRSVAERRPGAFSGR